MQTKHSQWLRVNCTRRCSVVSHQKAHEAPSNIITGASETSRLDCHAGKIFPGAPDTKEPLRPEDRGELVRVFVSDQTGRTFEWLLHFNLILKPCNQNQDAI